MSHVVRSLPAHVASAALAALLELFPNGGQQIVRDQASWTSLWAALNSDESPPPALPTVNFSTNMLIVAGMGTRGSAGYSVAVVSIGESGGIMTVTLTYTSPGPTCGVAAWLTSPVTVVAVPVSSDTVTFVTTNQTHNC